MDVQLALGARAQASHELPPGEQAKTVESLEALWHALRLERGGTLVALGGGCTTDAAGFAAATYLRGIDWAAVPTTLVGQVDAAIGGKTAIDLPGGKNLVGAFHWPARTVIDPATLETLPEEELENGKAEVVKTGLLAGEPLWELPLPEQVRRCAAFKTAVCLRDPHDRGVRAQLNLGHTFAHALETAAGYELPHGRAVALGLLAALRLSGLDTAAGRGDAASRARPSRPRACLGRARARQEGRRRCPAPRVARGARPAETRRRAPRGRGASGARRADRPVDSARVRIAVLNGVNLDVLDKRDAGHYGGLTLADLESRIYAWSKEFECTTRCRQTNHEGQYIDWCHDALDWADGVIINPGAWSHYSYALRDAVELFKVPVVEVHLSKIEAREEWRRVSVIGDLATKRVSGEGPEGYRTAIEFLAGKR